MTFRDARCSTGRMAVRGTWGPTERMTLRGAWCPTRRMALRGAWRPTGRMALRGAFYTRLSVLEENSNEIECVGREFQWDRVCWRKIPINSDDLGENSSEAECVGREFQWDRVCWRRIPINSDDLEENSSEAECVGREFQWDRVCWRKIPMRPSVLEENSNESGWLGREFQWDRNLGFVDQSWILNFEWLPRVWNPDPPRGRRGLSDEIMRCFECWGSYLKRELLWRNYCGVPRGVTGFLQNGHALMRWRYQSTAVVFK